VRTRSSIGSRSASWSTERPLAIGAVTVGWSASQRSATAAPVVPCASATSASAASTRSPFSPTYCEAPFARGESIVSPARYLPVRKPRASPK
jgi:hypothetical protein